MAFAAGVATLGAILHAAEHGSDIAGGLKQAEESGGKVIAAAEKLMGTASPDFEKFGEDLISQKEARSYFGWRAQC